jgi:predicted patatin/cPLA2 family phospholipase
LNWALRVWLKREKRDQNHKYARIVEGGGVRDVVAAEKMMDALLEDFSNIPQSGELRAGV